MLARGRRLVAVATMLAAVDGGHQAALMAPTEVLAEQHFFGIRLAARRSHGRRHNVAVRRSTAAGGVADEPGRDQLSASVFSASC